LRGAFQRQWFALLVSQLIGGERLLSWPRANLTAFH